MKPLFSYKFPLALSYLGLVLLITACPFRCDDYVETNRYLPIKAFDNIPYQDQDSVHFIHSAGQVIGFGISKQITEEYGGCEECCESGTYEQGQISLNPNYPIFSMSFSVNGDSLNISRVLYLGNNGISIPFSITDSSSLDSVYFNNKIYSDVLKLKLDNYWDNGSPVYADSVYYNGSSGILQVIMSNEEYYQLYE
jgi:hypothetical protein